MQRYTNIKIIFFVSFFILVSQSAISQIQWSEWKPAAESTKVFYRIAFAKIDETNMSIGYYVEFKNDSDQRIWFNFVLNRTNPAKESKSKVTLKASSTSLLGIHYTDISDPTELVVKISDLRDQN